MASVRLVRRIRELWVEKRYRGGFNRFESQARNEISSNMGPSWTLNLAWGFIRLVTWKKERLPASGNPTAAPRKILYCSLAGVETIDTSISRRIGQLVHSVSEKRNENHGSLETRAHSFLGACKNFTLVLPPFC